MPPYCRIRRNAFSASLRQSCDVSHQTPRPGGFVSQGNPGRSPVGASNPGYATGAGEAYGLALAAAG